MSNLDWQFSTSAAIVAAAKAAGLDNTRQKQAKGLAWAAAKHRALMAMPEDKAQQEYDKLDRKVQDTLTQLFGNNETYNPEETSFLGNVWKYAKKPFETAAGAFENYAEFIDRPFRTLSLLDDVGSLSEAWDKAADGKRLFDADRERIVDATYGPTVSKIAKRISIGDSIGDIISDLETDEEYAAMERFLAGGEEGEQFALAIRDYDQAKISIGRGVARLFGLNPNVGQKSQGAEGLAYNIISGSADLAYNILGDPMTYIAAPVKAYQAATRGVLQLVRAENAAKGIGTYSFAQRRILQAQKFIPALGNGIGFDAMFAKESVRKMWDTAGPLIAKSVDKANVDPLGRSLARQEVQRLIPTLDDGAIEELAKFGVKDADTALNFMKTQESVLKIAVGRSGSTERLLPTADYTMKRRQILRNGINAITGWTKAGDELKNINFAGSGFEEIANGQTAAQALQARRMQSFGARAAKMFDRALVERSAYTADGMRQKSAQSVYTLARSVFDRRTSDVLAKMFVDADSEAQARNIIAGLYRTIADSAGLDKKFVDTLLAQWNTPMYSETAFIGDDVAKIAGLQAGKITIDEMADGSRKAVAEYNITGQVRLPSLIEIQKHTRSNGVLADAINYGRNFNAGAVDFWSAFNLLPRLGLRSVLDEGLFTALTMPVAVVQNALKGYSATNLQRFLAAPQGFKDTGTVARFIVRRLVKDVDEATLMQAAASKAAAARLLETQLTKSIYGRMFFAGRKTGEHARYIAENVEHGNMPMLKAFSEGAAKNLATAEAVAPGVAAEAIELSPNLLKQLKKDGIRLGGNPTRIDRSNPAFYTNAHLQLINRIDRNGNIGKLAVAYLEKPEEAVRQIADYLRQNPELWKRFDRSAVETVDSAAFKMYVHVRSILTNSADEINQDILAKVRPNGFGSLDKITAAELDINDIMAAGDNFKNEIFGYATEMQVYRRFGDMIGDMIDKGFSIADRQIATLSREPAYHAYYLHYRDVLSSTEEALKKQFIANGMKPNNAAKAAQARVVNTANDLALNRIIGFVDNPHIRSNVAFSARNVARYYRATEDFYRRAGRVLQQSGPTAVLRLRLANEGMEHAGFIHEDDQGEKYFTFPVDEIIHTVYARTLSLFGKEVKYPLPLALSGKIKMLTPSLDLESNIPTFSGPFISVAWNVFKRLVPSELVSEKDLNTATTALFGQYAENAGMWESLLPSTIKKTVTALGAISGYDSDQLASATMKSMAMLAAQGHPGAQPNASMTERDEFERDVKATARNMLFLRNVLGIFSPVSPQFSEIQDIPDYALDAGMKPFKREFQALVEAEYDKGNTDAWNTALRKWSKLNPGRLVYTVSESEMSTITPLKKTRETVDWMMENRSFVDKYREASLFFAPQVGEFDMDAYMFLKREGFAPRKDLDKYFEDIRTVAVSNQYYDVKNRYEDAIANAATEDQVRILRSEMEAETKAIRDMNPGLRRLLEQREGTTELRLQIVENMRDALRDPNAPQGATANRLRAMVDRFNFLYGTIKSISATTDYASSLKRSMKSDMLNELQDMAGSDASAILFYDTILKRLLD